MYSFLSDISDMTPTSFAAPVALCTGKIIKNGPCVLERGENLLQNGILDFVFKLSQSLEIVLQS